MFFAQRACCESVSPNYCIDYHTVLLNDRNKKHLKNVAPIRHCKPFYIAIHQVSLLSHVACRLRIDVHDNDDDNNNNNA